MKKHVCITLDRELYAEAKKRSLKLSTLFSAYLLEYLNTHENKEPIGSEPEKAVTDELGAPNQGT